jgi:hypothetical protein
MPLIGRNKVDAALVDLPNKVNDDLRKIYFVGLRDVIKGTPVDKGGARNGWFLTSGSASVSTRNKSKSGSGSIRSLIQMTGSVINKKIFFTNNLPYIETLEYGGYPNPNKGDKTKGGYSNQAPKGWVRSIMLEMRNKIRALK